MEKYIEKASVLIEALPYIQNFRDKIILIKFGGSAMTQPNIMEEVLRDIVFLECVGINPVVVHGGGFLISDRMKENGISPKFVQGMRVTDEKTIKIVKDVLEEINHNMVQIINKYGGKAYGFLGERDRVIRVKKHDPIEYKTIGGNFEMIDPGFIGDIVRIDVLPLIELCQKNIIPVITPLGIDDKNILYNVNADTAAGDMAIALRAEKLVFLSDVPGILKDSKNRDTMISSIHIDEIPRLIESGILFGGMLPKARSGIRAVKQGVDKTHIIDGRILHSLLLEVFTNKGVGTEIVK